VTVSEAIALAGGPNRYAAPEEIIIMRPDAKGGPAPRRIPVDYTGILKGKKSEQDIVLHSGDTVYIP
jgi:polysaccharide biosynthesis/export protein